LVGSLSSAWVRIVRVYLPNRELARVPEEKLTRYLLATSHPVGRSKAAFFLRFGFSVESWTVLAQALSQHAADHAITAVQQSQFGSRYVIEGQLATPDHRNPHIRSVWFIDTGEGIPRFVTAYPISEERP